MKLKPYRREPPGKPLIRELDWLPTKPPKKSKRQKFREARQRIFNEIGYLLRLLRRKGLE